MRRSIAILSLVCLGPWSTAAAQYRPAPTQYTVVNVTGGETQRVYRDGTRALTDVLIPKSAERAHAFHLRTIVDVPTSTMDSWDLLDPKVPCNSVSTGTWGDPFDSWRQMALDDSVVPTPAGTDTVNGIPATVFEKHEAEGSMRFWRENRYGMLVKAVITPKGRAPMEVFETKEFKVGPPPASEFAVPKRCEWKAPSGK